ncbi:MAG: OadG family protein [Candidatus Accumulibacter sp.]|uniref:OadG family protein n=1 Tax=Accumulibacter sp. TaxID=2053492 RepID=UPI001D868DE5|nr:OadG family transporter subunit [Accumulibacter sp.]MCB1941247.1 OadG family protein [Accumulibacter sp.]MCP5247371.1 OadG family protein [Accumulibacter sp.]
MDFILEALQLAFIGMAVVLSFLTLLMWVVTAIGRLLPPEAPPVATPRAVTAVLPATPAIDPGAVAAAIAIAVALFRKGRR